MDHAPDRSLDHAPENAPKNAADHTPENAAPENPEYAAENARPENASVPFPRAPRRASMPRPWPAPCPPRPGSR